MDSSVQDARGGRPLRRNRDWVVLWTGDAVSELGLVMGSFAFTLLAMALTGSPARAALAGTAFAFSLTALGLPAGVLVDRLSRKLILCSAAAVQGLVYLTVALAVAAGTMTWEWLVVAAMIEGSAAAFIEPAQAAVLKRVVRAEQLAQARSAIEARDNAMGLAGPPAGGALFALAHWLPFALDAAGQLVRAMSTLLIRADLRAPASAPAPMWRHSLEGLRYVWSRPVYRSILLMSMLTSSTMTTFVTAITLRLIAGGTGPVDTGLVQSVIAASGLGGAFLASFVVVRIRLAPLLVITTACVAAGAVPIAFVTSPLGISLLLPLVFVLIPSANAGLFAFATTDVPDGMMGRFMAAMLVASGALAPFAPAAAGALLTVAGPTLGVLVPALILPLALVPVLRSRDLWRAGPGGSVPA